MIKSNDGGLYGNWSTGGIFAAKLYPEDIDKYIEYKSPVIEKIYTDMNKELGECRC